MVYEETVHLINESENKKNSNKEKALIRKRLKRIYKYKLRIFNEIIFYAFTISTNPENYENIVIGLLTGNNQFSEEEKNIFKEHIKNSVKQLNEILINVLATSSDLKSRKNNLTNLLSENKQFYNEIESTALSISSDLGSLDNNIIRLLSENRQLSEETKDHLKEELLRQNAKAKCLINEVLAPGMATSLDPESLKNNVIKLLSENKQFTKDDVRSGEQLIDILTSVMKSSSDLESCRINLLKFLSENKQLSKEEKNNFKLAFSNSISQFNDIIEIAFNEIKVVNDTSFNRENIENNVVGLLSNNVQFSETGKNFFRKGIKNFVDYHLMQGIINETANLTVAAPSDSNIYINKIINFFYYMQLSVDKTNILLQQTRTKVEQKAIEYEKLMIFAYKESKDLTASETLETILKILSENDEFSAKEKEIIQKNQENMLEIIYALYRSGTETKCSECNLIKYSKYCENCLKGYLKCKFDKWSSGNDDIDNFIQRCQINLPIPLYVLEWIPYDKFKVIGLCGEGGFSKIYKAEYNKGIIVGWDDNKKEFIRSPSVVVLKSLKNSAPINERFLNEVENCHKIRAHNVNLCRGITKDPKDNNYMMVLDYAPGGNLREFLKENR
ncbi:24245_t:CDS:2, partial [Gigaspora rosea]